MRDIFIIPDDYGDGAAELALAARSLGEVNTTAIVCGASESSQERLTSLFDRVLCFPASADDCWDAEYLAACTLPLIETQQPYLVLLLHSNNGLDLAPLLAAKCERPMLVDCLSLDLREQGLAALRTKFGGKVHARVFAPESSKGYLATIRPGAFAVLNAANEREASAESSAPAKESALESATPPADYKPRRRCLETLTPDAGAVDITQAETLVAVGRGIEEEENLEIVEALADALGGELACTRPVVDKQWMEKSRQVGTSGLTVKPKIYLTVGVSGSFQHLGGVKGSPFIVAINQDPAAPIFAAADVGIVGDLFELVPLLEEKIRARKG